MRHYCQTDDQDYRSVDCGGECPSHARPRCDPVKMQHLQVIVVVVVINITIIIIVVVIIIIPDMTSPDPSDVMITTKTLEALHLT